MSQSRTLDVGMAVHQESIAVASVAKELQAEVVDALHCDGAVWRSMRG
jgi:hypothetical protein